MSSNNDPETRHETTQECYDCERSVSRSALSMTEVPVENEWSDGYEMVPVPICRDCRLKRSGHDCEHCGRSYFSIEAAAQCCVGESKAPNCRECGRRMEVGSWGYTADGRQTIDWAECEGCDIGWGRYTGWHDLDAERGESA